MSDEDFQFELRTIKAAADAKKKAAEVEREAREDAEIQRLLINGRAIERRIATLIEPLLVSAGEQLRALGYSTEVTRVTRKPSPHSPEWTVCAIEVKLWSTASPDAVGRFGNRLEYRGEFEFQSLARTIMIRDRTVEHTTTPIALNAVTAETVKADVLRFFNLAVV
jgi:hypothetical protein